MPSEEHKEQPSTYFVQDRANQDELNRLRVLDRAVTASMSGALSEQPDQAIFSHVLDVGCGTGGWLIELAKTTPTSTLLIGVDVSRTYVEYARTQAKAAQVSDRVEFHVMDALLALDFPNQFFDLVNHRFAASWLRTWDWPKLLQEYQRMCHPGGIVRITEPHFGLESNSPALMCLSDLLLRAFYQAGYLFAQTGDGVTGNLAELLQQHGLQQVQTCAYTLEYSAEKPGWQDFCEGTRLSYRTVLPFLRKWTRVPDDYEEIYQQALSEMQQPGFVATGGMLTAWGLASGVPLLERG